ncbi:hypothetical protein [Pedobacter hartonius]|uniref:Uncharacterized protein n=1 Tax=Pedobacter hartonius TaxID=425514 RepID=A0A1H4HKD7_9SPHI|nr:hypothetical protein [Pedobacter hartonius]SEB22151.1 hypothetical protein SAMN05443550_1275 [Pedobacter hartonius]
MTNLTVNALLNLKEEPASLTIHGSVMTPHSRDTASIEVAESQGINAEILLVELLVNEVPGPMKMTAKPFSKTLTEEVSEYKQIQVLYAENESLTIDIQIIG